jgi:hypothetical protein
MALTHKDSGFRAIPRPARQSQESLLANLDPYRDFPKRRSPAG